MTPSPDTRAWLEEIRRDLRADLRCAAEYSEDGMITVNDAVQSAMAVFERALAELPG